MKIEKYVCTSFTFVKNWYFNDKPSVAAHLCRNISVAQCKVIRIPESRKFLLVESVLLGIGIQNPAFGIQNPTKEWIQNLLAERPFQIVLTAFTRIHATTVMLKATLETVQTRPCRPDRADQTVQTALISLENCDCYSSRDTYKFIYYLSPTRLRHWHGQSSLLTTNLSSTPI